MEPAPAPEPSLTEAHYLLLRHAARMRKPEIRAAGVARSSAVTTLIIAALATPFLLISPGWLGIVVVAGLFAAGIVELIGSRRIREGNADAAKTLGFNQLFLLGVITFYCIMQMINYASLDVGSVLGSSEIGGQLGYGVDISGIEKQASTLVPLVAYAFYSLVIVLSMGFQGGMAIYYFSCRKHIIAARQSMPAWVQRVIAEVQG